MQEVGYRVIPVNPLESRIFEESAYPDPDSIPETIDLVVVFRRWEEARPVVEARGRSGVAAVWHQEGIVDSRVAEWARQGYL